MFLTLFLFLLCIYLSLSAFVSFFFFFWARSNCGKNYSLSINHTNLCHCHRIRWWWFAGSRIRRSMEICGQHWLVFLVTWSVFIGCIIECLVVCEARKVLFIAWVWWDPFLVWATMNLDKVVTNSWTAVGLSESQLPVTFTGYCRLPGCCKQITWPFKALSFFRAVVSWWLVIMFSII